MERANIENLLHKYFEAETTLAEEKQLQVYFSSGAVDPALEEYRCLFDFYAEKQNDRFTKTLEFPHSKRRYKFLSIAASIAIIAGTFWWLKPHQEQITPSSAPVAYHKAMKNTQDLLLMMTSAVQTGKKQLAYLKEFSNTKNQFIQKK